MSILLTRRYLFAFVPSTLLIAITTGIPTDVLPNPWFTRMTPVRTVDLVLWPLTSIVLGALLATFALTLGDERRRAVSHSTGGGILSVFAIGCPICNKLVVAVLGLSGALTYFEPVQPLIGVSAIALGLYGLRRRVSALAKGCGVPAPAAQTHSQPA